MTAGIITKGAKDAAERCADENLVTGNKKIPNSRMEDPHEVKVKDEAYRRTVENFMKGIADLPENWDDMTVREQRNWVDFIVDKHMTNVPKSLRFLLSGTLVFGDSGRPLDAPKPEWFDHDKFLRGQRFAMDNISGVFLSQLISLFGLFAFEDGLKPLIITGKSSDPYTAFKRYLSTGNRIKNWYSSDPWTKGTVAYKDMQTVKKMHTIIRSKLIDSSHEDIDRAAKIENPWCPSRSMLLEDFRESCPVVQYGQCPYVFSEEEQIRRPKGMNQAEMSATQAAFVLYVILFPEYFGIHGASDKDLEAFCHVWQSFGYLLGIEDEFNFCNGTLEETKQRGRDFLESWAKPNLRNITPEWEHMMRCLVTGIGFYFPTISYEFCLLYVAEMLDIKMPRLEATLSYGERMHYNFNRMIFHWAARLPGALSVANRLIVYCMNRGLNYPPEKLAELKKHSTDILTKGREETAAAGKQQKNVVNRNSWHKNSLFVLCSTGLLMSLPLVANTYAQMQ